MGKITKLDLTRLFRAVWATLKLIPIGIPIVIFITFLALCWHLGVPETYGEWIDYVATSVAGGITVIIILTAITWD